MGGATYGSEREPEEASSPTSTTRRSPRCDEQDADEDGGRGEHRHDDALGAVLRRSPAHSRPGVAGGGATAAPYGGMGGGGGHYGGGARRGRAVAAARGARQPAAHGALAPVRRTIRSSSRATPLPATGQERRVARRAPTGCASSSFATASIRTRSSRVGRGEQAGRSGGVRVVEAPRQQQGQGNGAKAGSDQDRDGTPDGKDGKSSGVAEPIGTSHFESGSVTSVPRGTSAMVSILHTETDGEVVYLYDPESARGNAQFPFKTRAPQEPDRLARSRAARSPCSATAASSAKAWRSRSPRARSRSFRSRSIGRSSSSGRRRRRRRRSRASSPCSAASSRPKCSTRRRRRSRSTTASASAPSSTCATRSRRATSSRRRTPTTSEEKLGTRELSSASTSSRTRRPRSSIEEATPVFRTIDIRTPAGIELVRVYLVEGRGRRPAQGRDRRCCSSCNKDMANIEQQIATTREQMAEYRERMDELHAQIVTLKAVKTAGPLMQNLEKKLQRDQRQLVEGDDRRRRAPGEADGRAHPLPRRRRRPVAREEGRQEGRRRVEVIISMRTWLRPPRG